MAAMNFQSRILHRELPWQGRKPMTAWRTLRARHPMHSGPGCIVMLRDIESHPRLAHMTARTLSLSEIEVVLKGPTLSEMLSYGKTALSVAGTAWQAAIAPFAIFGTDHWGLNILFYFAVLLMGFNLVVQAPKQ